VVRKAQIFFEDEGEAVLPVLCRATLTSIMKSSNLRRKSTRAFCSLTAARAPRSFRAAHGIAVLFAGFAATWASLPGAFGGEGDEAVAISSKASADYVRPKPANGSVQAETYAFGNGGALRGVTGGAIDKLDFMDVARAIAGPLATQSYVSGNDPKTTRLLIMVYWGTTRAPGNSRDSIATQNLQAANQSMLAASQGSNLAQYSSGTSGWAKPVMQPGSDTGLTARTGAQMDADNAMAGALAMVALDNNQRSQLDAHNASLLGYDSWWDETARFSNTPLQFRRQEMIDEIEASRYFVVLMAYDFQMMWKEKKSKLLWETRFSVRERDGDFGKELAAMAASAAPYFGQGTGILVHKPLPEGRVEVGPIKTLACDPKN
jgi:hypothetical protein